MMFNLAEVQHCGSSTQRAVYSSVQAVPQLVGKTILNWYIGDDRQCLRVQQHAEAGPGQHFAPQLSPSGCRSFPQHGASLSARKAVHAAAVLAMHSGGGRPAVLEAGGGRHAGDAAGWARKAQSRFAHNHSSAATDQALNPRIVTNQL